ncbi:cupin [Leptolyngbya sp. CCY15150]|uniref:cysteine dioxygenase family protein n=1 Tax=Leptolyngbya sp. CCY15150 TaxID=2767772 RepID=UPI001951F654|nr:cupin [Leptolyngbya sp. CCY15150]
MTEMLHQDWFVDANGQCQPCLTPRPWGLLQDHYYLHQFLSDVLHSLTHSPHELDQQDYLPLIRCKVRQLILNSYWLRTQRKHPDPKTGTAVITLYDEIGYPLTVQTVTTNPGTITPIHNHGTWGVVAILKGQEHHTFWRKLANPDRLAIAGQQTLQVGEIISFVPDAIHQVETIGPTPALTFQLYGDTQPKTRFQFEPDPLVVKPF